MPSDVKIKVSAPGADKTQRDLKGVAHAEKQVGDEASRSGKKTERGFRKTGQAVTGLAKKLKGLLGAYLGLQGARMIMASLRAETEKVDEATRKAAESMRALMALSTLKGERREVRDAVWDMAVTSGRPIEQVAPAYYTLMGGTSGMGQDRRQALAREALLMGKTDPGANLDAMMGLFSTIGTQQPDLSPRQIGNIVSRTIEQAKSTPEEMSQYLPGILTTAKAGGADLPTATAMFSFATRHGGGVATSGTAVRAAMLGLLAPSPDVAKQLGDYGYSRGDSLMEKISWLSQSGGQLPPELVTALGGRRGLEAISAISAQPESFRREVSQMQGAMGAEGSLLKERLRDMYGEVPAQRYLDQAKQWQVILQKDYAKPEESREQAIMNFREVLNRRRFGAGLRSGISGFFEKAGRYVTGSPMPSAGPQAAAEQLIQEGYPASEIEKHVLPSLIEDWKDTGNIFNEGELLNKYRGVLEKKDVQPMQGKEVSMINQSGTFYNINTRRDPAGRTVERLS